MWKFKRVLSIFIIVTFICVNMPINVLAQGVDDLVNKIVPVTKSQEKSRTETTILKEVEEKREKRKVYQALYEFRWNFSGHRVSFSCAL